MVMRWFTTLKNRLFGNWDKGIATVSLLIGIVSVTFSFMALKYPNDVPDFIIKRDITIAFSAVGLIVALLYLNFRQELVLKEHKLTLKDKDSTINNYIEGINQLKRNQEEILVKQKEQISHLQKFLSNQLRNSYQMIHNFNSEIFKYFELAIPGNLEFSEITEEQWQVFERICNDITLQVREAFIILFKSKQIEIGNDISVTVKLLIPSENIVRRFSNNFRDEEKAAILKKSEWIITAFRDPVTHSKNYPYEREIASKVYDVQGNSAFFYVINMGEPHYFNNNLKLDRNYRNENPFWKEAYNSTVVVPIRFRGNSSHYWNVGLLAVDSLNKSGLQLYDDEDCKYLLSHAANILATFFLQVALFQVLSKEQSKPMT